jgi:hypothetical protein
VARSASLPRRSYQFRTNLLVDRGLGGVPEPALMAMATFARETGAFVLAEGIEDEDMLEFLRAIDHGRELVFDTIIQGGQASGLGRPLHELSPAPPTILRHIHSREHSALRG